MVITPKLKIKETDLTGELKILNKELVSHFTLGNGKAKTSKPQITINSTLVELSDYMNDRSKFDKKYNDRVKISPDTKRVINNYLEIIDRNYLGYQDNYQEDDMGEVRLDRVYKYPVLVKAYFDIMNGENKRLSEYTSDLLRLSPRKQTKQLNVDSLIQISKGVVLAYKQNELKERLSAKSELPEPISISDSTTHKLTWQGTPSQFGLVIDSLVKGGYLKRPTSSYKKDALFYLSIFKIDATLGTLEKELSEVSNSVSTLNRKKFKIPPKDELK